MNMLCLVVCGHLKAIPLLQNPYQGAPNRLLRPNTAWKTGNAEEIFFLPSKLLTPCRHFSLAKKESQSIFCPVLVLPRNEGCLPKDWGSWPGGSNKGHWSWAHSLAICPWTPCFSDNCLRDTSSGLCQTLISAGAGFGDCPKPVWKSLFQTYVCAEYINPAKTLHLLVLLCFQAGGMEPWLLWHWKTVPIL